MLVPSGGLVYRIWKVFDPPQKTVHSEVTDFLKLVNAVFVLF